LKAERVRRLQAEELEKTKANAEAIRAECKTFYEFVKRAWHVLEPTTAFVDNWHIRWICTLLEAVTAGKITRLLINIPPGMMKSLLIGVLWPAWEWGPGGKPGLRYFTASYKEEWATRDSRKMRDLVASPWYQALWGDKITLIRTGEADFENSMHGGRMAVPMASMTVGRGDRVIIDDPHSVDTAESDTDRAKTARTFREAVTSRVNDAMASVIVVVMQRLHSNDLSGVIIALGGYVHFMCPMEFELARRCSIPEIGFVDPRTEEGELLFPARFPKAAVERDKATLGSYAAAGQYQQRPVPREGGLFKRGNFAIVGAAPAKGIRVRRWDLAASERTPGTDPDWTVGLKMVKSGGAYYIEHVIRFRGSAKLVANTIRNTAETDGKDVYVRLPQDPGQAGKSQKLSFIQMLAGWKVRIRPETGSKVDRAEPLSVQAEGENVYLVKGPWNETFLEELELFPGAPHDDQVDGASGAFNDILEIEGMTAPIMAPIIVTAPRPDMGS